ncbi:hypothetical protein SAMN04488063_2805 [Halopelagius inordinatus]|uniref:Uncharacterized protein n=1 Tax=Halopelagius inordinatus TaxID=553467 RepID=A0A1I2UDC0_9EURY|nr:hypothetical protein [Halopelagius inordinatus]SFG72836.1 hypothetical protein SAMN04488063_2805 [Halopelagius inordinatus]
MIRIASDENLEQGPREDAHQESTTDMGLAETGVDEESTDRDGKPSPANNRAYFDEKRVSDERIDENI